MCGCVFVKEFFLFLFFASNSCTMSCLMFKYLLLLHSVLLFISSVGFFVWEETKKEKKDTKKKPNKWKQLKNKKNSFTFQ